jgi:hypothetical protein
VWKDVEVISNTGSVPAGMDGPTFAANKFGASFEICHIMSLENFKMYLIGGDLSNPFTAAIRIRNSEGVSLRNFSLEGSRVSTAGRYLDKGIQVHPGGTVTIDGSYIEANDFTTSMIEVEDNAMLTLQGVNYWNDNKASNFLQCADLTPVTINGTVFGENCNITDRVFKCTNGAKLKAVLLYGTITLYSGPATGGAYYDANAVSSKFGLPSDAITTLLTDATGSGSGTVYTGYVPSITSNYITITPGRALINGFAVGHNRSSALKQRLFPELAHVGTWNVKISSTGAPFIEKQSATLAGSVYSKTIATFSTTGGTNNPSGLTLV